MKQSKVYVGNLSYDVTAADLQDHFGQYGEIADIKLIIDRATGRSKGFAFVTFVTEQAAQGSLASNGVELSGRTMKVNEAKEEGSQPSRDGRSHHRSNRDDNRW